MASRWEVGTYFQSNRLMSISECAFFVFFFYVAYLLMVQFVFEGLKKTIMEALSRLFSPLQFTFYSFG